VNPVVVMVVHVIVNDPPQVLFVERDDMVENLAAAASHPAFNWAAGVRTFVWLLAAGTDMGFVPRRASRFLWSPNCSRTDQCGSHYRPELRLIESLVRALTIFSACQPPPAIIATYPYYSLSRRACRRRKAETAEVYPSLLEISTAIPLDLHRSHSPHPS
jgi:hypothetical protein